MMMLKQNAAFISEHSTGASTGTDDDILERARTDRAHLFDLDRFTSLLVEWELDAVVAFSGHNVTYSGGAVTRGWDPLQLALTTAAGTQILVLPADHAQHFAADSWISDIRRFHVGDELYLPGIELLAEAIRDAGITSGRVGLEGPVQPGWSALLESELPDVIWVQAEEFFEKARLVKSPGEIELFRVAALRTQEAIMRGWADSRPGDTEKQIAARVQSAALHLGAETLSHCQLQAGIHSTVAMAGSIARPAEPGEVVHIDFGAVFAGYHTDLARNAVVVAPSANQASIYGRLWDIHCTLIDAVRPGVLAGELADLSKREFDRVGLEFPWGAVGHGTGLSVHEGFVIAPGSRQELQPGMLLNIEPSHIETGDARYHIEDTLVVTEDGHEVFGSLMDGPHMVTIGEGS